MIPVRSRSRDLNMNIVKARHVNTVLQYNALQNNQWTNVHFGFTYSTTTELSTTMVLALMMGAT